MSLIPPGIKGAEKLLEQPGVPPLPAFSVVVRADFSASEDPGRREYRLDLVLDTDDAWQPVPPRSHRVHLRFEGVTELALSGFGRTPTQVCCLVIDDVSHRQLEGVKYQVSCVDNNDFGFFFRAAEVVSVRCNA